MISNISIAKFYHKPRYCLIINDTYVIKIPKKTWNDLYEMIEKNKNRENRLRRNICF